MMAGRPRREPTETQRADIHRLARKFGKGPIAARLGLPISLVRRELQGVRVRRKQARPWTDTEDRYLRDFGDHKSKATLARELRALGYLRSERAIAERVVTLMGLGFRELRLELTLAQVAQLIGRCEDFIARAIERRTLKAFRSDGAWRVVPSALRAYVIEDKSRVDWLRCEVDELADLLAWRWGKPGKAAEGVEA